MRSWRAESKSTVSRVQSLRKMNKKKNFEDKGRDAVALSTPTIRHSSCRSLDADSCSVNNFLFRIGLSRSWLHYFQEINLLICGNLPREPCVFRRVLSNSRFDSPTFLGGSEAICSMHPQSHQNTGQHQNNTSQNKEKNCTGRLIVIILLSLSRSNPHRRSCGKCPAVGRSQNATGLWEHSCMAHSP